MLPPELTSDTSMRETYKSFFNRVNNTKEVGVMDMFAPPTYFFVPKTKGNQPIDNILIDLFEAINHSSIENLLMTHWMYLSSRYPQKEIHALIKYLQTKYIDINLNELYILIDDRFKEQFLNDVRVLEH